LARKACRPDAPIATRNDPQKSLKDQKDITKQPGFIGGKSHKSINPDSRFNFINAALWQNEEGYWKAFEKSAAPMKAKLQQMGVEMTPALFNVTAWQRYRNHARTTIEWTFTRQDADRKLGRHYVANLMC